MESQVLSAQILWEATRTAAAFEVERFECVSDASYGEADFEGFFGDIPIEWTIARETGNCSALNSTPQWE